MWKHLVEISIEKKKERWREDALEESPE